MADSPNYNTASLGKMAETFGKRLTVATVAELSARGVIFVEDGYHGENRPRQDEFAATGIPFLRPPDLKDGRVDFQNCGRINSAGFKRVRKGIGQRGDIILTHRATVGRIAITGDDAPEVFVTNPGTTVWRSTDGDVLDQRYLYCFMRSAAFMDQLWSQVGNNSTFDYVSLTQQRGLRVAFPPLPEQRAIVAVLGALDDKIELNRRMNETLEALAQSLFKSWFVDATQSALPKGWRETTLDELAAISGGKQLPTEECKPSGKFTVFGANGIMGYAERATHEEFVIAFGRVGAYCGSIHWAYRGAWINNNASSVVPHRWPEFILQAMLNVDFAAMRTGSAQPFIPNSALSAATTVRPTDDILDSYCSIVRPLRLKQTQNEEESRTLAALRDALLPKLLSGELRVPVTGN